MLCGGGGIEKLKEVFEKIYRENFQKVYAFLFKMTKDADLSEELTQETFYQAFKSFHRFKGDCNIFTWLISIAKHLYYKYLRKKRLSFESIDISELENFYFEDNNFGRNPADAVMQKYIHRRISGFIGRLPDKYRDVVLLRIYADMHFSQIAASLDISENSARVIFYRAKKMLSEDIKNEFNL